MKARLAALMVLAAAGLFLGVDAPARASLRRAAEEQRRLRAERRQLEQRLRPLERGEAARARALATLASAPLPPGQETQALRRTALATLQDEPLRAQRVAVRPARGAAAPAVELSCEGGLETVLGFVTRLTRPGNGLVLARTRIAASAAGVSLDLLAEGLRAPQ